MDAMVSHLHDCCCDEECSSQPAQDWEYIPQNPQGSALFTASHVRSSNEVSHNFDCLEEYHIQGPVKPQTAPPYKPYWTTCYDLFGNCLLNTEPQTACECDLWAGDFERQEAQLAFARKCQPILREEYMEIVERIGQSWRPRR